MQGWKAKEKSRINGKSLKTTLMGVEKQMKRLARKIEGKLKPAATAIGKGKWKSAIRTLAPYVDYKGYPAADRARELWAKIEAAGDKQVEARCGWTRPRNAPS